MPSERARSIPTELLTRCDPGWLFLVTGIVLVAAIVLLPARSDLEQAEWLRDQVLAEESYRGEQLANYSSFLGALQYEDPKLVRWLAASQLNMAIGDHEVLLGPVGLTADASVFPTLDPTYRPPPAPVPPDSLLHRLANDEHTRLWVVLGGMLCIFYGLLPPSAQRAEIWGDAGIDDEAADEAESDEVLVDEDAEEDFEQDPTDEDEGWGDEDEEDAP